MSICTFTGKTNINKSRNPSMSITLNLNTFQNIGKQFGGGIISS